MPFLPHVSFHRKSAFIAVVGTLAAAGLVGCLSLNLSEISADTVPSSIPGPGVTAFAAGDIADCGKHKISDTGAAKTAALIAPDLAKDPAGVVFTLGDHTYPVGTLQEFERCYDPTWGRFKSRTYPSPGNHEYYTPGAIGYTQYFGDQAAPDHHSYYSFNVGSWHIISLNSNMNAADHQQQLAWLKQDLAQHPARCTLAYWHHPLFSSGGHGNNPQTKDLWQALYKAGADVVLNGHDHDYERFAPQDPDGKPDAHGIREFVVGTGGGKLTPFLFRKANSEAAYNLTHGVLRLTLKPTGYEWQYLPVAGHFTDHGAGLCH